MSVPLDSPFPPRAKHVLGRGPNSHSLHCALHYGYSHWTVFHSDHSHSPSCASISYPPSSSSSPHNFPFHYTSFNSHHRPLHWSISPGLIDDCRASHCKYSLYYSTLLLVSNLLHSTRLHRWINKHSFGNPCHNQQHLCPVRVCLDHVLSPGHKSPLYNVASLIPMN